MILMIPIEKRKLEQMDICLKENVVSDYNYWDDVCLVHNALPEVKKENLSTSISLFGKKLNYPILIAAMSGGHSRSKIINENCAKVASELGIGLCVGSQRAALEDLKLQESYSVVKDYDIPLVMANIGASQLVEQKGKEVFSKEDIQTIMDMIDADMLTIHLNFPQEMIQPEGNENAFGILEVIKNLSESFPIIVKECGSGITREVALLLKSAGIKGIEVSGVSGTSWVAVEYYRAKSIGDKAKENAGKIFWNWGVPSPVSVIECKKIDLPIVGSGGIRHGLDIAKSIAVGGDASSMARVLLSSALEGSDALMDKFKEIIEELKTAMFLTGSKNIEELKKAKYVLTGKIKDWVEQRSL